MDLQRAMEVLLENQGRFFSGLEELRSLVGRIAQQQLDLIQHVDRFQGEISSVVLAIAHEQKRLAEEQRRLAEEQTRLTEAQRHTDESLNALIAVVDDIIRRPKQ